MQIDWITLTYVVIALFAVGGFFRGWWKEAFTTLALVLLLILLQRSDWAQTFIDVLNRVISVIWQLVARVLNSLFGFVPTSGPFQFDATSAGTWIIILILFLGIAAILANLALPGNASKLPGKYYSVAIIGRVLGLLLGAVNGFLIIGLLREYLDGRALPGSEALSTEIVTIGSTSPYGQAADTVAVQAVNLPNVTILDSYLPFLLVGLGLLILLAAIRTRVKILRSEAGSKVEYVSPYGYQLVKAEKPKDKDKDTKEKLKEILNE